MTVSVAGGSGSSGVLSGMSQPSNGIAVPYTKEERALRIARYLMKKQRRVWKKNVKYDCRKRLAEGRPRVKGRFVSHKLATELSSSELAAASSSASLQEDGSPGEEGTSLEPNEDSRDTLGDYGSKPSPAERPSSASELSIASAGSVPTAAAVSTTVVTNAFPTATRPTTLFPLSTTEDDVSPTPRDTTDTLPEALHPAVDIADEDMDMFYIAEDEFFGELDTDVPPAAQVVGVFPH